MLLISLSKETDLRLSRREFLTAAVGALGAMFLSPACPQAVAYAS
jgi:hypothetical protein